jgi:predicted transcriptional regulator
MSFIDQLVLRKVNELYRDIQGPVRTQLLADLVGKHDRTMRYVLVRLETRGLVQRRGQRGGWLPARAALCLTQ